MSRKTLYNRLFACLLCLLPSLSHAQSLTRYEYWFDDDFGGRVIESMSGTDQLLKLSINTDQLDNGVHKFSFRVRQSGTDYPYSPITSSLFLKRPAAQNSVMEYWFDDNFEQRDRLDISNTEDEQEFVFDLRNNTKYPWGFHKLNIRITLEGGGESAVYSTGVLKLSAGKATKLEYWIDDDYANVRTISGELTSDGEDYKFISDLDLGGVSPGHHRLHCRPVSNSRITAGAVTTVPIIVKSRYNTDPADVKMTKYSISVDDEEPLVREFPTSKTIVDIDHILDASRLPAGNHHLKAKFWNTANAGVSVEEQFNVPVQVEPTLMLTAVEQGGLVNLKFNAVPNDLRYRTIRVDANGAKAKVDGKEGSCYPATISYNDNPAAGTYTYYVQTVYTDSQGEHPLNSNEVTVVVAKPQTEVVAAEEFGYITGEVLVSGNRSYKERLVKFSDGVSVKTNYIGSFYRDKIPVGTTLTLSVEDEYAVDFEEVTVTVKPKANYSTINGIPNGNDQIAETEHDLQFDSFTEITPGQQFRFKVKNISRSQWTGRVCVKSIKKEYADNPPTNTIERPTDAQVLAGSMAPFEALWNYDLAYSEEMTLEVNQSKDVLIMHTPFHWPYEDEYYYFYFESVNSGTKVNKLIAINSDYNIKENPHSRLIARSGFIQAQEEVFEEDIQFVTNFIVGECSAIKELDEKLGKLTNYFTYLQEVAGNNLEYSDYTHLKLRVDNSVNYSDLPYDAPIWRAMDIFYQEDTRFLKLTKKFRDDISTLVRGSKNLLKFMKQVNACLDYIQEYEKSQNMTTAEQMFALSDRLLKYSANDPFSKILKTYLDVAEISIQNALLLGEKYHSNFSCEYFSEQNMLTNSERENSHVYKQNKFYDFKIRVKRKGWLTGTFSGEDLKRQIYNVTVTAINHNPNDHELEGRATMRFEPIATDDGVYLRQIGIEKQGSSDLGYYLYEQPIEDMWMNIEWANGRVSRVPLRHGDEVKGDGVKFDGLKYPFLYTVSFQSEIKDKKQADHLADIIYLDDK